MAETKIVSIQIQTSAQTQALRTYTAEVRSIQGQLKSLQAAEKRGLVTAKEANKQRSQLTLQLKANRNALRDVEAQVLKNNNAHRKNLGFIAAIRKGFGQLATSYLGFAAAIGIASRVISGSVKIFKEFEKAGSKLQAILGVDKDAMSTLTNQAKELGATTSFTATQVVELQTEFAKLGFTMSQIEDMTGATLNLAAAAGTDLANAATIVGSTLRGFGLDASQTTRLTDVMAASFSATSLDIEKFSTAMAAVAPAANAVGLSVEQTTAFLGTLTNSGIDASTAGTGLRNVFIALKNNGLTLEEAMEKIRTSSDKLSTSYDLFGKRGATLGVVLSENEADTKRLTREFEKASGTAKEMADIMLDNLAGDITIANSAWEGFILSIEDGEGVISQAMRSVTGSVTELLNALTTLNEEGGLAFLTELGLNTVGKTNPAFAQAQDTIDNLVTSAQGGSKDAIEALRGVFENYSEALINSTSVVEQEYFKGQLETINQAIIDGERAVLDGVGVVVDESGRVFRQNAEEQVDVVDEMNEDKVKSNKDAADELLKQEQELLKRINDANKEADKLRIEAIEDEFERERQLRIFKFEQDIADLDESIQAEAELILEQERALIADLEAIRLEENQAILDQKLEAAQAQFDQEQGIKDAILNQEEEFTKRIEEEEEKRRAARNETLGSLANFFGAAADLAEAAGLESRGLAITEAIIQTYLGATRALGSAPPPANFIQAGAVIASGLANIIKIQTAADGAIVQMNNGGMLKGYSHAMGGIPIAVNGSQVVEAEGGEAIINKRSMANPLLRSIASWVNQQGGGVSFDKGGMMPVITAQMGAAIPQLPQDLTIASSRVLARETARQSRNIRVINVAEETAAIANDSNAIAVKNAF